MDPRPRDPLGELAAAAGYDDPERWWEDVVEHRGAEGDPFEAIGEAMSMLRKLEMRTHCGTFSAKSETSPSAA